MTPTKSVLCALIVILLSGCMSEDAKNPLLPGERLDAKRTELIATCPAKAPSTYEVQDALARDRGLTRVVWEDQYALDPVSDIVLNYVKRMPKEERTWPWVDHVRNRIVVPVTKRADREKVLSDLRSQVEDPDQISVEVVRYSEQELARIAEWIGTIPDLELSGTGSSNSENVVTVDVPGNAKQAREKILASTDVDPCSFKTEGNIRISLD